MLAVESMLVYFGQTTVLQLQWHVKDYFKELNKMKVVPVEHTELGVYESYSILSYSKSLHTLVRGPSYAGAPV